jgi:CubicO group peptidase (beta-lactamase class C family)
MSCKQAFGILCAIMAWISCTASAARAQDQSVADSADARQALAARLDGYLTRAAAFGFSGAVLVVRNGEQVLCKGYGIADRSTAKPYTSDTAFEIASVTKQITAFAVLKLELMGKLQTSRRIEEFLDGVPADKAEITLHHLLTHTAGIERGEGDRSAVVGRDEMVAHILGRPLIAPVGERYSYSNWGYTLLAAVIERCSGQTFQGFLRQELFEPLGMTQTGFWGEASRWPRASVAHSYFETIEEGCPLDWPLTWRATGGGYVISTLPDLFRWETELRSGSILSAEAKQRLFTPQVHTDGTYDYAYGWHVGSSAAGTRLAFHAGYYKNFGCEYRRYLDDDVAVIVATNEGYLGGTGSRSRSRTPSRTSLAAASRPSCRRSWPWVLPLSRSIAARTRFLPDRISCCACRARAWWQNQRARTRSTRSSMPIAPSRPISAASTRKQGRWSK